MTYGLQETEMDRLITSCRTEGERISSITTSLETLLANTFWSGPDADAFRAVWTVTHRADLSSVTEGLTEIATNLRRELDDQVACSGS